MEWQEGRYKGNLTSAVFSQEDDRKPAMVLTFDIDGNERKVFLYCSDAAWEYTETKLKRLGFNGDFDSPDFEKKEGIELDMKKEEHEGKWREKWNLAGGFTPTKAADDLVKRFNAKWKATNSAPPSKPAGKPPSSPPAPVKGPPPAAAKPPPPRVDFDKNKAWERWGELSNSDPNLERWHEAIAKVGKDESNFDSDDWKAVYDQAAPNVPI